MEQENLSAAVAYGGLDGLRLLSENKDDCFLIILDVMMPDLDGFFVCGRCYKGIHPSVLPDISLCLRWLLPDDSKYVCASDLLYCGDCYASR